MRNECASSIVQPNTLPPKASGAVSTKPATSLLLGIFFVSACLVVVVNLLVDLIYVSLDPRIEI